MDFSVQIKPTAWTSRFDQKVLYGYLWGSFSGDAEEVGLFQNKWTYSPPFERGIPYFPPRMYNICRNLEVVQTNDLTLQFKADHMSQ